MESFVRLAAWPVGVETLCATGLLLFIGYMLSRPSFPKTAPKILTKGYPILGALRFFSDRTKFYFDGITATKSGNFSFYFGKHQIVALSGLDGRRTFFENKALNITEGYAVLLATSPSVKGVIGTPGEDTDRYTLFTRNITKALQKEKLVGAMPYMICDVSAALARMVEKPQKMHLIDPFEDIYRIVYQLTMRVVGAKEIAESQDLLVKTLKLFEDVENSSSPARIIFPWLLTPAHIKRITAGAKLYTIFSKIAQDRKTASRKEDDALQLLLDRGDDIKKILSFMLGALFAGLLNSATFAAWLLIDISSNKEWMQSTQHEVDAVLAKHRLSEDEPMETTFARLTIEEWEAEFPLLDLCLHETLRLRLDGNAFRKNISGSDIQIGSTGEVVPKDAFAFYLLNEAHLDPEIYPNPNKWDPTRYSKERAEGSNVPLSYLAWGIGRHPCLGMRFAKLEMNILVALLIAKFDFYPCDAMGNRVGRLPTPVEQIKNAKRLPREPLFLKLSARR